MQTVYARLLPAKSCICLTYLLECEMTRRNPLLKCQPKEYESGTRRLHREKYDQLSRSERSIHMAKIRSKGNRSTELFVESVLRQCKITGWKKHPANIVGTPDFFFPKAKLAVFVNGCFWHGCRRCARNIPQNRREFWIAKLEQNRRRDVRVLRQLRRMGIHAVTVWEHALRNDRWINRIITALE